MHEEFDRVQAKKEEQKNEDESRITKLMEDVVRIYRKLKEQETVNAATEKKIGFLNDKIVKTRAIAESKQGRGQSTPGGGDNHSTVEFSNLQSDYSNF